MAGPARLCLQCQLLLEVANPFLLRLDLALHHRIADFVERGQLERRGNVAGFLLDFLLDAELALLRAGSLASLLVFDERD